MELPGARGVCFRSGQAALPMPAIILVTATGMFMQWKALWPAAPALLATCQYDASAANVDTQFSQNLATADLPKD